MEVWKDIPEYEGLYQVSNLGNVKRLANEVWVNKNGGYFRTYPEEELKPIISPSGYYHVNLYKNKKLKTFRINRLVLMTFDRMPEKGELSMHLDNNKLNNRLDNLKWGTCRDNVKQMHQEGRNACVNGSRNPMAITNEEEVAKIKILYKYDNLSISEIAKIHNKKYHFVYEIVKNLKWNHVTV
jgi:hypothetical protein